MLSFYIKMFLKNLASFVNVQMVRYCCFKSEENNFGCIKLVLRLIFIVILVRYTNSG